MNKRDKRTIEDWREKNRKACALLQVERDNLLKRVAELEAKLKEKEQPHGR